MLHTVAFSIAFLIVVGAVACWVLSLFALWVLVKLLEYSPESARCGNCGETERAWMTECSINRGKVTERGYWLCAECGWEWR